VNGKSFWDYVGVQGVIALLAIAAVVWMAVTSQPIPEELQALALAAAAFYFGSKKPALARVAANWLINTAPAHKALVRDFESALTLLANIRAEKPEQLSEGQNETISTLISKWWE
jgi:hypothetical protein